MSKEEVNDSSIKKEPKKKNKKTLIIIIIVSVVSFCFLSSAAATGGVLYWKKEQEKQDEKEQSEDASNNEDEQDEDVDDQSYDDQDNDENDNNNDNDNDDQDDEDDGGISMLPTLDGIYKAMDELKTYSMTVTSSEATVIGTIYAEYEAPDKMRIVVEVSDLKYESIAIGDDVYTKQNDGPWTQMDFGYTDVADDFMSMLDDEDYMFLPSGEKGGYWYYEIEYEGTTGGMYVTKVTNYVKKIEVTDDEAGNIVIEFDDFNSDEIDIQKPI